MVYHGLMCNILSRNTRQHNKIQIIQRRQLNANARTKYADVIHMLSFQAVSKDSLYRIRRENKFCNAMTNYSPARVYYVYVPHCVRIETITVRNIFIHGITTTNPENAKDDVKYSIATIVTVM